MPKAYKAALMPPTGSTVLSMCGFIDKLSMNEGMFCENTIAQMLSANGHKLYFYTCYSEEKHRNDIEIDFLISKQSKLNYKLFPIEVKLTKKYASVSLLSFREKFRSRIGECYSIHPEKLSINDGIIYLLPYLVWLL